MKAPTPDKSVFQPVDAAVAQLVPTPELIASLAKLDETNTGHRTLPEIDLRGATDEDLAALALANEQRCSMYAMLARVFRTEADQQLLEALADARFASNTGNGDIDAGYRMVATYLGGVWEHTLNELAVDYVHAFVGYTGDHVSAAYPFESVYRSEKHLLMQEHRDQVLALYRAAGLEKSEGWREGEDHIALEFEFMQVLAARCAQALSHNDVADATELLNAQQHFLEDHVQRWVPGFTLDVERCAQTGFYQGFAKVTRGFIDTEYEFFSSMAGA